jgi:hypothetical protein
MSVRICLLWVRWCGDPGPGGAGMAGPGPHPEALAGDARRQDLVAIAMRLAERLDRATRLNT